MKKILIIFVLAFTAVALLLAGCGKNNNGTLTEDGLDLSSYPIDTDITLTYYMPFRSGAIGLVNNYGETHFAREYEKRTGVKIEYIHPALGQENETLNLMISSNDLADIIEHSWGTYQGGVGSAISNKIIIGLNDYTKFAPAYFKLLKDNPQWDKPSKTDEGIYYGFQSILESPRLTMTTGPTVRADWLRELGIPEPETISDWEEMLTAFKEKKGASIPFSYTSAAHALTMLGVHNGLYIDGEEYKHGYSQPELKTALTVLHDWFKKGLLDKNILSVDSKMLDSQVLNNQTGALIASGGDIERYMQAASEKNQSFELVGVKFPTYERGKNNECMSYSLPVAGFSVAAISAQCKYPKLAMKVLDYLYTDEGYIFANFGTEGYTYTMENDIPTYTDLIVNNPDGLSVMQALSLHVKAGAGGPYVTSEGYINQYYKLPQQQKSLDAWQTGLEESSRHRMQPVSLTPEESEEYSAIISEVVKYAGLMRSKFITGIEPIEKFDEYINTLNQLGLPRALEIQTEALKRYNNR